MNRKYYDIEAIDISKNYNGFKALDDINLKIEAGDITGVFGPNGSGKTTLLDIITSIIKPTTGSIIINQIDLKSQRDKAVKYLGVMAQDPDIDRFDHLRSYLITNTMLYGFNYREAARSVDELAEIFNLDKDKIKNQTCRLSGGMIRRALLIKALAHKPRIAVLDEPTVGLDSYSSQQMNNYLLKLNSKGMTILLTTHIIDSLAKSCRSAIFLRDGHIIEQGPVENFSSQFSLSSYSAYVDKDITAKKSSLPSCVSIIEGTNGRKITIDIKGTDTLADILRDLHINEIHVTSIEPQQDILSTVIKSFAIKK